MPLVRDALKKPVSLALLKGRSNYLCHHFLQRTEQEARLPSPQDARHLRSIQWFAKTTLTGDKAECLDVAENSPVWNLVTSTRESCLGSDCGFYEDCFVVKARREAQAADVVVVNHHLFLADLALRDEGTAELLPDAQVVVFDEAHQLRDIATQFFGQTISTHQWLDLLRDILIEGRVSARDAADWDSVLRPFELHLKTLRADLARLPDVLRIPFAKLTDHASIAAGIAGVTDQAEALMAVVIAQAERSEEWQKLAQRVADAVSLWRQCMGLDPLDNEVDTVRWVTLSPHMVQLHCSPMDIAASFSRFREGQNRAWIFASATLSVRNSFEHFNASLGLVEPDCAIWPSPFDYEQQALMCVPADAPDPQAATFSDDLAQFLFPLVQASDGGVFFLCTTLRATAKIGRFLEQKNTELNLGWTILIQGQAGKAEMLKLFRSSEKPVLVGSASFWEGVDVKGDGLRLVIIDKIPFAPPDDPLVAARNDWYKDKGLNPFFDLAIPEAAIALKQGAGRLIRDEGDQGVLVIGDKRILTKGYGQTLWRSLPPFARTRDLNEAVERLNQIRAGLTTTSTTAPIA
jgi:ATP-dependent DNA helicase DinG